MLTCGGCSQGYSATCTRIWCSAYLGLPLTNCTTATSATTHSAATAIFSLPTAMVILVQEDALYNSVTALVRWEEVYIFPRKELSGKSFFGELSSSCTLSSRSLALILSGGNFFRRNRVAAQGWHLQTLQS